MACLAIEADMDVIYSNHASLVGVVSPIYTANGILAWLPAFFFLLQHTQDEA